MRNADLGQEVIFRCSVPSNRITWRRRFASFMVVPIDRSEKKQNDWSSADDCSRKGKIQPDKPPKQNMKTILESDKACGCADLQCQVRTACLLASVAVVLAFVT